MTVTGGGDRSGAVFGWQVVCPESCLTRSRPLFLGCS